MRDLRADGPAVRPYPISLRVDDMTAGRAVEDLTSFAIAPDYTASRRLSLRTHPLVVGRYGRVMLNQPISPEAAEILENRRREVTAILAAVVEVHPTITLELGCGHGHFLTAYAGVHRDEFCLGIDRQGNRITRSLRKQGHADLPNLRFVRAEVRQFLDCLPADMRLARIFVLFPDPWPKRRHIKNRMLSPSMLAILARHATPGTELFMRTDDFGYLEWVETNLGESMAWRIHPDPVWPFEWETVFQRKAGSYRSLSAVIEGPAR